MLVAHLRRERVRVVHAHMFGSNVWGTICGRAAGVPVVVAHEHSWSFEGERVRRLLDRHLIARFADAFVAVSRADREAMLAIEHIPADRVRLIPNGIDDLPEPTHDLRAELGIAARAPVLGTLSVFRHAKRLDVLIHATALLQLQFPDLTVLIAGHGPEEDQLRTLVAELELTDVVRFLGVRADRAEVLATVDVAVCSSDREGSPLSIMEYMDSARPIVATAVGGVPDLIEDGVHGRLVEPGSPRALADAIAATLDDPSAGAMGARARARRRAEFRLDATVRRIEELYLELLGRRDARWSRDAPTRVA
jgi:glycosyltransferase involved in cell wall biosynthesis